jgi:hypothetical protein
MPATLINVTPSLVMHALEDPQSTWFSGTQTEKSVSVTEGLSGTIWLPLSSQNFHAANFINRYVIELSLKDQKISASALNACENAKNTIRAFATLVENWDGYGAAAISDAVISNGVAIIDVIEGSPVNLPTPEISPNPNGTIALEWETPNGEAYIEIGNSRYGGYVSARHVPPLDFEGETGAFDSTIFSSIYEYLFAPHKLQSTISNIQIQEPKLARLAA